MNPISEFQYPIVNEFVKQVMEGYVLSSIEEDHIEFKKMYKNIREWIYLSYANNFDYRNNELLQQITKEIFDQILYFRLTGKITGVIPLNGFGKL
jgi:ubiquinone/menaquinone biosynthesis C-methylase UbiE